MAFDPPMPDPIPMPPPKGSDPLPETFDYSDIRPRGQRLSTSDSSPTAQDFCRSLEAILPGVQPSFGFLNRSPSPLHDNPPEPQDATNSSTKFHVKALPPRISQDYIIEGNTVSLTSPPFPDSVQISNNTITITPPISKEIIEPPDGSPSTILYTLSRPLYPYPIPFATLHLDGTLESHHSHPLLLLRDAIDSIPPQERNFRNSSYRLLLLLRAAFLYQTGNM
jgi:hypothetical protein